jgi:uncharacterized protein
VHVSELANRFVRDPAEAVKVGDKVKVRVLEVDLRRKRIALSIKRASENLPAARPPSAPHAPRSSPPPAAHAKPPHAKPQAEPAKQAFNNPFAKLGSLKRP